MKRRRCKCGGADGQEAVEPAVLAEKAMGALAPAEMLLRLGAAALCGGLIGFERELRGKTIGLRTVMLVAIGTAVLTLIGVEITLMPESRYNSSGDLGRLLQGLIAGLGMLGAGMFLHRDDSIRLATSGAGVWLAGTVGIACGLGLLLLAAIATVIALIVLAGIGYAERHFFGRKQNGQHSE